jgi:polar amino acid transport system substrate-binding protein
LPTKEPDLSQNAPSPSVLHELAPTGKLRATINYGNAVLVQQNAATGALTGVTVDLAEELARRCGIELVKLPYDAAGKVADAASQGIWDVCFLAIDPKRAQEISFTAPYVIIESAYMVPAASMLQTVADVDRDGVRVAVGKGAAYDLYLTRTLKHASIERAPTSESAVDLFVEQGLEAVAGVRQPLEAYAAAHPEVRMLPGRINVIEQAMGLPEGRPAAWAYVHAFVEEMKASGFVADSLARHGQKDAGVAPPA